MVEAVEVVAEVKIVAVVVVVVVSLSPADKVSLGDSKMAAKPNLGDKVVPVLEGRNIPICQPEINSGAGCITGGGEEVIFVQPQRPAHGRMFLLQSYNHNENLTSSAVEGAILVPEKNSTFLGSNPKGS